MIRYILFASDLSPSFTSAAAMSNYSDKNEHNSLAVIAGATTLLKLAPVQSFAGQKVVVDDNFSAANFAHGKISQVSAQTVLCSSAG